MCVDRKRLSLGCVGFAFALDKEVYETAIVFFSSSFDEVEGRTFFFQKLLVSRTYTCLDVSPRAADMFMFTRGKSFSIKKNLCMQG